MRIARANDAAVSECLVGHSQYPRMKHGAHGNAIPLNNEAAALIQSVARGKAVREVTSGSKKGKLVESVQRRALHAVAQTAESMLGAYYENKLKPGLAADRTLPWQVRLVVHECVKHKSEHTFV